MLDANFENSLLTHSMLTSLAGALPTMDPRRIRAMGITPDQAIRISRLTTTDMMRLASSGAPCLSITVDSDALEEVIETVIRHRDKATLMMDCVLHDASREMMAEWFEMTPREYTRMRQRCGLPPAVGRPKECTLKDAERFHDAWHAYSLDREPGSLVLIAEKLDLSLRVIWSEIGQYDLDAADRADSSVA